MVYSMLNILLIVIFIIGICIVFIACSAPPFVCVAMYAVFCLSVVCYEYLCVVSYCSTTATGQNPFAVKINNIINNNYE
jgi:hypothetical protein